MALKLSTICTSKNLCRICVILAILFNAMIIHDVVPSMFGLGIVVPLIKGHNLDNSISENYRGTYEDSYFKNF